MNNILLMVNPFNKHGLFYTKIFKVILAVLCIVILYVISSLIGKSIAESEVTCHNNSDFCRSLKSCSISSDYNPHCFFVGIFILFLIIIIVSMLFLFLCGICGCANWCFTDVKDEIVDSYNKANEINMMGAIKKDQLVIEIN
jgi:hypothetical protein